MTATATIVAKEAKQVIAIPASFITTDTQGSFVYVVVDEEHTERRSVTTGLRGSDSFVQIISGLTAGEKLSTVELK
jgi:multidrug efflux pump subunit AcrA (membrane-fusion protein)